MTAARHYRVSVVLVEHHAPLCNLRLYGKQTHHVLQAEHDVFMPTLTCFTTETIRIITLK